MNLVLTVLEIVAPIFLLSAVGFGWARLGFDYPIDFVTRLTMTFAVPCLIFTALAEAKIGSAIVLTLGLAAATAYLFVIPLTFVIVRAFGLNLRTHLAPLTFGNTGNLGLPLALFAFGEPGLSLAVVVFAIMAIIMFTLGLWMVAGTANPFQALKEPILWAAVLGVVVLTTGWSLPDVVLTSLSLMGQLGIPLMLLTLGAAVARLKPANAAPALALSAAKLLIGLATALLAGAAFGLTDLSLSVLVLQLVTPVGVTSYLLAERYKTDPETVASLVVISTLLAIAVLPVTLSFLIDP